MQEERLEATKEDAGHIEGYTCSVCVKHFSDAQGLDEISDSEWIIPKLEYDIGDVNKDGFVDVRDMQKVFNIIAGKTN